MELMGWLINVCTNVAHSETGGPLGKVFELAWNKKAFLIIGMVWAGLQTNFLEAGPGLAFYSLYARALQYIVHVCKDFKMFGVRTSILGSHVTGEWHDMQDLSIINITSLQDSLTSVTG